MNLFTFFNCGLEEACSGFALTACIRCLRLGLCPRGFFYALAAWALPSWLMLCPRGLGFALAARAMCSQLGLCPCNLRYVLAAWALPSRLALRACGLGYALAACTAALIVGINR